MTHTDNEDIHTPANREGRAHPGRGHEFAPAAQSRGSRSGVIRLVAFCLVATLVAWGLHATIGFGLRQIPTSKFGSLNNVFFGKVNADIVINGSSRALTHYDPRALAAATGQSAYNLGMNGVQTDVQLAVLKTYLSRNAKPKLVIQNLESFSFEATKAGEIYDPATYVPYLGERELYSRFLEIDPAVWKWKYIPLYGYTVEDMKFTWAWGLLGCFGIFGKESYIDGFNPRYTEWTEDFARFSEGAGNGVTYRIETRAVNALREIVRSCRDQGIEVIFVYSPEYIEMQALERNRAEIFALFSSICAEFNIPLWDYSGSYISTRRDLFYNSQHLNARGAHLFSAEIAQRVADHLERRKPH